MAEFINYLSNIDEYCDQLSTYATANSTRTIIKKLSISQLKKLIMNTAASIKNCSACETDNK